MKHIVTLLVISILAGSLYSDDAPPNDKFADSIPITGSSGTVTGSNFAATFEQNEPRHYNGNYTVSASNSVWWSWTAPDSGLIGFYTTGSEFFRQIVAVYTGSSISTLTKVNAGGHLVHFHAAAGQKYHIAILSENDTQAGNLILNYFPATLVTNSFIPPSSGFSGIAASDGSILTFPYTTTPLTTFASNKFGVLPYSTVYSIETKHLTVTQKDKTSIIEDAIPPGLSQHFKPMAYDGTYCYIYDYDASKVMVYSVKNNELHPINSLQIDHVYSIGTLNNRVYIYQIQANAFQNTGKNGCAVYNKYLTKELYTLPLTNKSVRLLNPQKNLFERGFSTPYAINIECYKKEKRISIHTIPIPLVDSINSSFDRSGGLFYWPYNPLVSPSNGVRATYIDAKGNYILSNEYIDSEVAISSFAVKTLDYVYGLIPDGNTTKIIAYKLGKKIRKYNEKIVDQYFSNNQKNKDLYAHQGDFMSNTYGFTCFDQKLSKSIWSENMKPGAVRLFGKNTACRSTVIPGTDSTNYTFTIFNRKKTISDHSFVQ